MDQLANRTPSRRERERDTQRRKILDAALAMIFERGFAAMSMRKLGERIGYSAAAIYLHFRSREQIAQELSELGFSELLALVSQATAQPDPVEALHAMGAAYVGYGLEHPQMYRLIFMGDSDYMQAAFGDRASMEQPDSAGPPAENSGQRASVALFELGGRLHEAGFGGDASPVELAELIWMTLHGIVSLQLVCVGMALTPAERLTRLATESLARR